MNTRSEIVFWQFFAGNDAVLQTYIEETSRHCEYLRADRDISTLNKYLLVTAEFCRDKVFDAYVEARSRSAPAVIEISYQRDLVPIFERLGLDLPGSPQDLLYTLTSERAGAWIPSLTDMGFLSACMSGVGEATLLTSSRFLDTNSPDLVLSELQGAISAEFYRRVHNDI